MTTSARTRLGSAVTGRRPAVVWTLVAFGLAITALAVLARIASGPDAPADRVLGAFALLASVIAFLLSGAIIAARQPGNVVGWLLMVPGLAVPVSELGNAWLQGLDPPPTSAAPGLWLVLWFCSWAWLLLIFPIFTLLLTFPDGRLLSKRWWVVVALELAMVAVFIGFATLTTRMGVFVDDEIFWSVPNPIGQIDPSFFDAVVGGAWQLGLLALTVLSVGAIVLRYRRGSSEARHQLKWPLAAIAFFGIVYAVGAVVQTASGTPLWAVAFALAIGAIPVSVAIAVLKYRLYEIDRIVSRTVSWALVTGLLAVVFVALVIGLQTALDGFTRDQTLAVAASTLVAAALFNPLRIRVQRAVDRRFNRARYDAERIALDFTERLRRDADLATVSAELRGTATEAFEPRMTVVWLRTGRSR